MIYTITEPAPPIIDVTEAAVGPLTISQPSPVVTVLINQTGVVTTAFAQRDYLGATPTYASGILTQIAYSDGTMKSFNYSSPGIIGSIDYDAPNSATLRKTLTWASGIWQGTSAPEVI